jgi:hypothetical protein
MQLTKQQKAGMAAAALAVGVLGVDRFVLGTGGPASASAQQAVVVGADAVQAEGPKPKAQAESGPTFAQRLDGFASARGIDPTRADVGLFGTAAPEVWTASAVIGVGQGGRCELGSGWCVWGRRTGGRSWSRWTAAAGCSGRARGCSGRICPCVRIRGAGTGKCAGVAVCGRVVRVGVCETGW